MTIPAPRLALPDRCLLVSYDAEANASTYDYPFITGSTLSIGWAFFVWPAMSVVNLSMSRSTGHVTVAPTSRMSPETGIFWNEHPEAYKVACAGRVTRLQAATEFVNSIHSTALELGLPVAMLARPHVFDAPHAWHLTRSAGEIMQVVEQWSWHDLIPTLAHHLGASQQHSKQKFFKFLPKLPHIADHDAYLQGVTFFNCLRK